MQDGAAITFFDRTYDEALALLVETRNYLAERQQTGQEPLPAEDQLVASCEAMRLTSRLVQVMAWLLVQKAVHAGELDPVEADLPRRRLGGHEVCAEPGPWDQSGLPRRLKLLLERSLALYNRVARLDEMVHIRASQIRAAQSDKIGKRDRPSRTGRAEADPRNAPDSPAPDA